MRNLPGIASLLIPVLCLGLIWPQAQPKAAPSPSPPQATAPATTPGPCAGGITGPLMVSVSIVRLRHITRPVPAGATAQSRDGRSLSVSTDVELVRITTGVIKSL